MKKSQVVGGAEGRQTHRKVQKDVGKTSMLPPPFIKAQKDVRHTARHSMHHHTTITPLSYYYQAHSKAFHASLARHSMHHFSSDSIESRRRGTPRRSSSSTERGLQWTCRSIQVVIARVHAWISLEASAARQRSRRGADQARQGGQCRRTQLLIR